LSIILRYYLAPNPTLQCNQSIQRVQLFRERSNIIWRLERWERFCLNRQSTVIWRGLAKSSYTFYR